MRTESIHMAMVTRHLLRGTGSGEDHRKRSVLGNYSGDVTIFSFASPIFTKEFIHHQYPVHCSPVLGAALHKIVLLYYLQATPGTPGWERANGSTHGSAQSKRHGRVRASVHLKRSWVADKHGCIARKVATPSDLPGLSVWSVMHFLPLRKVCELEAA